MSFKKLLLIVTLWCSVDTLQAAQQGPWQSAVDQFQRIPQDDKECQRQEKIYSWAFFFYSGFSHNKECKEFVYLVITRNIFENNIARVNETLQRFKKYWGVEYQGNGNSLTPLMFAAAFGSLEMVQFLVDQGAKVNATEEDGWTPLMFAAMWGKYQVVEFLIKNGASVNKNNKFYENALDFALLAVWDDEYFPGSPFDYEKTVAILREHGAMQDIYGLRVHPERKETMIHLPSVTDHLIRNQMFNNSFSAKLTFSESPL